MIQTKVARILSPTQVILAAGSDQGVREGMEFIIYDLSDVILDPETNEPLGQLELVKGRVKASHVQKSLTFATTMARNVVRNPLEALSVFAPYRETIYEQLPVDESSVTALQTERKVKIGDLVRSVEE